jgi:adenylate cyclase
MDKRLMMKKKLLDVLFEMGVDATDSDDVRQEKNLVVGAGIAAWFACVIWGVIYTLAGELVVGSITISGFIVISFYLVNYSRTGNISRLKFIVYLIYLVVPTSSMWFLGGLYPASVSIVWSFVAVIMALITSTQKRAFRWFFVFILLLVISGFIQRLLPNNTLLSENFITTFFVLNLGSIAIFIFMVLRYFIDQKNKAYALLAIEQKKSDNLLLNVLPKEIADILKENDQTIADHFDEASILFADLVGFTPLTESMAPEEMIGLLNEIYSHFDNLVDKYGLEKIRTIGDNYMVASGVPKLKRDHAQAAAKMALEMQSFAKQLPTQNGHQIDFRIGINSGPLVAGVIGKKKFHYDVWGDTVNTASRMESHGVPGKIQVTEDTYKLLEDEFIFEPRGKLEVKGKGEMETWFLTSRKS